MCKGTIFYRDDQLRHNRAQIIHIFCVTYPHTYKQPAKISLRDALASLQIFYLTGTHQFFRFLDSFHSRQEFSCGYSRSRYCCWASSSIFKILYHVRIAIISYVVQHEFLLNNHDNVLIAYYIKCWFNYCITYFYNSFSTFML